MKRLRLYRIEIILVLVLAMAVAFFGYLGYGLLPADATVETFSGERALARAQDQVAFGARVAGVPANIAAGDALVDELVQLGWNVLIAPFGLPNGTTARNIIAVRTNKVANAPVGILGAHYDSRLLADADPDSANQTLSTPGAVDNAAGVAVLIELARTLDVTATGHTICLVLFDADDNANITGWEPLLGTTHFLQDLNTRVPQCGAPRFAVIVDTIGYAGQSLTPDSDSHPGLSNAIWQTAAQLDYPNQWVGQAIAPTPGAHTLFTQAGIPATILSSPNYPHDHTMQDTVDKLNVDSLSAVGNTLENWLEAGAAFGSQ